MKFFKVKKADIGEKYRGNKNFPLNIPLDDFNKVKENAKLVFDPRTKKEEVWSYIGNNGNLDLFELLSYENVDNKPWVKLVVNNLSNSYYNKDLYYDVGASYDISNLELKNNMKKESAIQQPNKPKPTTMLPDNMEWAWDPEAADWVAVLKDNTNTTPPLYDPNNQNVVNQTTNYMSTVKSASNKNIDSIIEDYKEKVLVDVSAVSTKEDDFYKEKEIEVEEEIKEAQKYVSSILDNKNAKSYLERQVQKTKEVYGENSNYYNYAKFVLDLYNEMSRNSDIRNMKSASKKVKSEKSMMDLAQNIIYDVVLIHKAKSMDERPEWDGTFAILTLNPEKTDIVDIKYIPQSSLPSYTPNDNEYGLVRTRDTGFDDTDYQLQPLEMIINQRKSDSFAKDDKNAVESGYKKQSSCLSNFLDGPRYSKEIKIEAGLIKNGLVKYAGFDFNRGTKYAITDKGLEVLRKASEKEHNEALNEREKLAYMFGFNTDKETTLDTTGKIIKSDKKFHIHLPGSFYTQEIYGETIDDALENYGYKKDEIMEWYDDEGNGEYIGNLVECDLCGEKYEADELVSTDMGNICFKCKKGIESKEGPFQKRFSITEADGTPLGKVTASSELDAKVKFGIEHPEYADSQSISAKVICASETEYMSVQNMKTFLKQQGAKEISFGAFTQDVPHSDSDLVKVIESHGTKKIHLTYDHYKVFVYTNGARMIEDLAKYNGNWKDRYFIFTKVSNNKNIDAKYEETTESHEPYINPSETPNDHIILENHDGWVNTASFEDDVRKQFQQPHQKLPNSDRDLALLEKQILEITDEDTRDTVRKIFDEFQFSDKEAAEHRPYTEEEKRLLPLFRLLNQHIAKKEIQIVEDPQKDGNIVATGQAEVINDLEHEVKDLGFHCEPIAEITDEDYIGYDIYSLRIFTK